MFNFFDEGVFIYEQIRNIELYTDQKLKDLQIYKIFEYNFSENRNLYGTGDLGEVYVIITI